MGTLPGKFWKLIIPKDPLAYNRLRISCRIISIGFAIISLLIPFSEGNMAATVNGVEYIADPMEEIVVSFEFFAFALFLGYVGFKVMKQPREPNKGFIMPSFPPLYPLWWVYNRIFGPKKTGFQRQKT